MNLSNQTEWNLIDRISQIFSADSLPPSTLGIGDDAALIPWTEERSQVITTDLLLENTHFLRKSIPARDLGYKSLAVNLSDIAAMGGSPTAVFLSLGLPQDLSLDWFNEFMEGFRELSQKFQVRLLGGDTTRSSLGIAINVTALGQIENAHIKLRSDAQSGDLICVTGFLGDSAAGLQCVLNSEIQDPEREHLIQRHHRPEPQVREAQWLSRQVGVHAMMDLSDGLASDLPHILEKSASGAEVDLEKLPISQSLKKISQRLNWSPAELAASGGEDYGLLTTIDPNHFSRISTEYEKLFSSPLSAIGRIGKNETEKENALVYKWLGETVTSPTPMWNHFRAPLS
jgi:thiamine-monophosphate kinase